MMVLMVDEGAVANAVPYRDGLLESEVRFVKLRVRGLKLGVHLRPPIPVRCHVRHHSLPDEVVDGGKWNNELWTYVRRFRDA